RSHQSYGSMSLYRNYWRAGKQSYDQGKYDEADKALSKVVELSPNSPDAPNAKRLLANIKLLKGKLKVKSRAEKAAAVQVTQQISAGNTMQLERQTKLLEEGKKAAEKGDAKRAQQKFQAAEALGTQLVAKGENVIDQTSRLRDARKQLDVARKATGQKLGKGLKQLKQLRKSGRIAEAGVLAEDLAENAEALSNTDRDEITKELQKEREQLAIASAKATLKVPGDRPAPPQPQGRGEWQSQGEAHAQDREQDQSMAQNQTRSETGKKTTNFIG
ncbi:MAG: hypothetical protein QGG25_13050, partial [Phycisphaerae bacterium]|nr:hypothetical protein [Phycisphaerae bacterium]